MQYGSVIASEQQTSKSQCRRLDWPVSSSVQVAYKDHCCHSQLGVFSYSSRQSPCCSGLDCAAWSFPGHPNTRRGRVTERGVAISSTMEANGPVLIMMRRAWKVLLFLRQGTRLQSPGRTILRFKIPPGRLRPGRSQLRGRHPLR